MKHKFRNLRFFRVLIPAALLVAFAPFPTPDVTPTERYFQVEAKSFEFFPAELYVNPGDHVTIELIATDVVHGLFIDGYDLEVKSEPGQPATLTFVADRPGSFRTRCSVTCGDMHPFMIGKLHVGPNRLLWRGMGLTLLAVLAVILLPRRYAL
jgi:heme/copper-type cytochrome/quinol oxidase subunit 2